MKMGDGGFWPAYNIVVAPTRKARSLWGLMWLPLVATWPRWRRWLNRSSNVAALPRRTGWSMAAFQRMTRLIALPIRHEWLPRSPSRSQPPRARHGRPWRHRLRQEPIPLNPLRQGQGPTRPRESPPARIVDPYQRKPGDSPAVGEWRERMGTDECKDLYKERAAVAECVSAQARNRNLVLLPVRGTQKVKAVAYLYALVHNLMRMISRAPELSRCWR